MENLPLDSIPAAAVVIVVIMFLRYLSTRDKEQNIILTNHMKHEEDAFIKMTEAHIEATKANREMHEYFRGLNGHLRKKKR